MFGETREAQIKIFPLSLKCYHKYVYAEEARNIVKSIKWNLFRVVTIKAIFFFIQSIGR